MDALLPAIAPRKRDFNELTAGHGRDHAGHASQGDGNSSVARTGGYPAPSRLPGSSLRR